MTPTADTESHHDAFLSYLARVDGLFVCHAEPGHQHAVSLRTLLIRQKASVARSKTPEIL